jgi:hypothetical protein
MTPHTCMTPPISEMRVCYPGLGRKRAHAARPDGKW